MERARSIYEQVTTNLPNVAAAPQFAGGRVWLTFYLCGPPADLQHVSEALADAGWLNTGGWEDAFLYPKLEVDLATSVIMEVAHKIQVMCEPTQVEILGIDADTSPDVTRAKFMTLYST